MLWALDETALDLFARRPVWGFHTGLRFVDAAATADGFQPRQVVEVDGSSATPKMLVLLHVVAAFLLRSVDDAERATQEYERRAAGAAVANKGGETDVEDLLVRANERVFLFDHEYEANASQLLQLLDARLRPRIFDSTARQAAARRAMDRVVVYHCQDTFQCLATLNHIHFELLDAATAPLLLVFNCIGSFHAMDKMTAKSVGDGLALTEQVFIFLKQFSRHHNPIIFASKTTPGRFMSCDFVPSVYVIFDGREGMHGNTYSVVTYMMSLANARNGWERAEYLPSSWTSQVSKRILLRAAPQPKPNESIDGDETQSTPRFEVRCTVQGQR